MSHKVDESNYLEHFGILGMKWGVRRYQPYPKSEGHKGKFVGKKDSRNKTKAKKESTIDTRIDDAVKKGQAKVTTDPKTGKRNVKFKDGSEWNLGTKQGEFHRDKRKAAKNLKKEQKAYDENFKKNWVNAYNKAANHANEVLIPQINKKYGKYDWTQLDTTDMDNPKGDPKLVAAYKKYTDEYEQNFNNVLAKEYDKMFGKRPGE